jgi:hypothetical protein
MKDKLPQEPIVRKILSQEEEKWSPVDRGRAQGNEREAKSVVGCQEEV